MADHDCATPSRRHTHRVTASAQEYRLHYQMTADAMIDAAQLHQAGIYRLVTIAVAMIVVSAVIVAAIGLAFPDLGWLLGVAVLLVAWGAVILGAMRGRWLLRWGIRRNARSVLGGTTELVLGDEGLAITTPYSSGFVRWSQVTAIRENERTVVFERDRLLLGWVPSTAFASAEQRAAVLRFAREQIARRSADPVTPR